MLGRCQWKRTKSAAPRWSLTLDVSDYARRKTLPPKISGNAASRGERMAIVPRNIHIRPGCDEMKESSHLYRRAT